MIIKKSCSPTIKIRITILIFMVRYCDIENEMPFLMEIRLRSKAEHVAWRRVDRKEVYALFARSFKARLDEPDVMMYDVEDLREMVERRV